MNRPRSSRGVVQRWVGTGMLLLTNDEIEWGRKEFERLEPRDLRYHACAWLLERALAGENPFGPAEVVALFLRSWNESYYMRWAPFDERLISSLEELLEQDLPTLLRFRNRSIRTASDDDETEVKALFVGFSAIVKQTGASKALHILAPGFFPMWDERIRKGYGVGNGSSSDYWRFLGLVRDQARALKRDQRVDAIKAIDEFNFCRYTRKLMKD